MPPLIDLCGKTIGNFLILRRVRGPRVDRPKWLCRCICGKELTVFGSQTAFRRKASCGCKRNVQHGHTRGQNYSPTYYSWRGMRNRCLNPKQKDWSRYGGRGIKICERWNSFVSFLKDMGPRPEGKTLDRINVNKNYDPSNCIWSNSSVQAKNRRTRLALESFSDEDIRSEFNRRFGNG